MNANIFSCTVPPLFVLETQIINPELLQSLCTTHWDPFFWQTYARGRKRLRARADVYACTYPSARALTRLHTRTDVYACTYPSTRALTRLRTRAPVCAHPYPSAPARTCLRAPLPSARALTRVRPLAPVCARPHPSARHLASARALRQRGFRFDTSASLKLPTVKKKMVKKFLHADVRLKRTDGQVCPSVRVLNGRPNLHVRLVRQPCLRRLLELHS